MAVGRCGDDRQATEGGQRRDRRLEPETGRIEDHLGPAGKIPSTCAASSAGSPSSSAPMPCVSSAWRCSSRRTAPIASAPRALASASAALADRAVGADYQEPGAGLDLAALQGVPGGAVGHPATGGLGEAQAFRLERDAGGRQGQELRVATVAEESRLRPVPQTAWPSRAFGPPPPPRRSRGPVPGAGWYREAAEDVLHVARIQPGGADFHPHLIGGGKRVGHVHQLEGGEVAGTGRIAVLSSGLRVVAAISAATAAAGRSQGEKLFAELHAKQADQGDGGGAGERKSRTA